MGIKGYVNFPDGDKGKEIALPICTGCSYFRHNKDSSHPYVCLVEKSNSAAHKMALNEWASDCEWFMSHSDYQKQEAREGAILDRKPRPPLSKIFFTGLFISIIWALAIVVYGKVKTDLIIDTPLIKTLLSGIPVSTIVYTILRLLKNLINRGATDVGRNAKIGGNLLGWLVANVFPLVSPVVVYYTLAKFVFYTKIL